ncbi:DUF5348 domain-containing protein [Neobacillus sp. Marseille-QA0830]
MREIKTWTEMEYNGYLKYWEYYWAEGTRLCKVPLGESFKIHLGNGLEIPCQIEFGKDWYMIIGPNKTKFYLNPRETYQIVI